jgi:RNA polymerase sigma-70 factor, ECF subfamily
VTDLPAEQIEKLLNQIRAGSNKAVRELYLHYQASLFAFIRFRIRDDGAAEEILDDTFLIAFRTTERFNASSNFKTWLFGIAKNVCGTWIRKQQTGMARSTVELEDEHLATVAAPDWNILEKLESEELNAVLRACMDKLPELQREVLFWTWFEEEPLEAVAIRAECPVGTVKSRLFHARSKVADCVKKTVGMEANCV